MTTRENQENVSSSSSNSNRKDPGWKYNFLADPKDPNSVTCSFCNKITKGGIFRAKQHQIGKYRNAKACHKCPPDVKEELENHITQKKTQKSQTFEPSYHLGDYEVDEEIEVQELHGDGRDKRGRGGGEAGSSKKMKTKASNLDELSLYKKAIGLFGSNFAKRSRSSKSPAIWWDLYGGEAPKLREFAVKVLSLTCSASGCERNWSMFEQIHSKRRNKLEHQKLQDLVYIKYNQKLKALHDMRDEIDPICLEDIDNSNEWLIGKMGDPNDDDELVFDDEQLSWRDVGLAMGVEEPLANTRQATSRSRLAATTSRSIRATTSTLQVEEDELDYDEDTEEEEEEIEGLNSDDTDGDDDSMDEFDEDE